jgi:hypothetical protein
VRQTFGHVQAVELGSPAFFHRSGTKPVGVLVIAVLFIIVGIIDLATVVFLLAVSGVLLPVVGVMISLRFGGIVDLLFSIILLVSGMSSFMLAYGLWKGRGWAWTWTLISSVLSLIASMPSVVYRVGAVGLVIYPIIIVYLTRHRVRAYFAK